MNAKSTGRVIMASQVGPWVIRTVRLFCGEFMTVALGPALPGIDENMIRRECCQECAKHDHAELVAIARIWGEVPEKSAPTG